MFALLTTIHIIVSFIMIGVILLQAGKGAEIGATFGGSSQTIFGSRGAATFLSKLTIASAVVFMVTSISLAILSKEKATSSLLETKTPISSPAGEPGSPEPPLTEGTTSPEETK